VAESHRQHPAVDVAKSATERARRAAEDSRAAYGRAKQAQDLLRRTEARVSQTEAHVAATLRDLATAARLDGRPDDAERLDHEADLAEQGAAEARRRSLSTNPPRTDEP
jgi:uncharacterized membrane protein YebE (DUF533 family)